MIRWIEFISKRFAIFKGTKCGIQENINYVMIVTLDCAILLVPLLILIDSFEEVEIQKEDLQEY